MGVAPGFDCARIISGRQHHGADAVHDALVVRRGAVGIQLRQACGMDQVVHNLCAADQFGVEHGANACQPQIRLVGEDAQDDVSAADLGHSIRDCLGHRVDGVGAHGISYVDVKVKDDVGGLVRRNDAYRNVLHATADTDQLRVLFVGECNDFFTCLEESDTGGCRIHDVDELYLGLHDRRGTRDVKAAESACDASSVACGCDHRRLLGGERDQVVRAVDREVGGHADRDADDAEDVLDHAIGLVDGEAVGGVVDRDVCFGQVGLADDLWRDVRRRRRTGNRRCGC